MSRSSIVKKIKVGDFLELTSKDNATGIPLVIKVLDIEGYLVKYENLWLSRGHKINNWDTVAFPYPIRILCEEEKVAFILEN